MPTARGEPGPCRTLRRLPTPGRTALLAMVVAVAPMSLGCAGCGGCCDPVHLSKDERLTIERLAAADLDQKHRDTRTDVEFVAEHWHEIRRDRDGGAAYRCDRYDADSRQCTAHDDRPPVCRGFPFYDRPGDGRQLEVHPNGEPSCSYWLDVPAADRPEGIRPLIPLTVLR